MISPARGQTRSGSPPARAQLSEARNCVPPLGVAAIRATGGRGLWCIENGPKPAEARMSEANVAGLRLGWLRPDIGRSRMIPAGDAQRNFETAFGANARDCLGVEAANKRRSAFLPMGGVRPARLRRGWWREEFI